MSSASRLAAGIAAVAVVVVLGLTFTKPGAGPGAAPTPSPSVAPSSAPSASPAATASDAACRLITTTEAASVADFPDVGAIAKPSGTGTVTGCNYTAGGGSTRSWTRNTRVPVARPPST